MVLENTTVSVFAPNFDPALVGGAGVAMQEIVNELIGVGVKLEVWLTRDIAELYPQWGNSVRIIKSALPGRSAAGRALNMLYWQLCGVPASGVSDRLVWFPFGTGFPSPGCWRRISTLVDALHIDLPHCVPWADRIYRRLFLRKSIRTAELVTISEFCARRIREAYQREAVVVPFAPANLPSPDESKTPEGRYFFFPAIGWKHKNHRFLIDLWASDPELRETSLVFTLGSDPAGVLEDVREAHRNGLPVFATGRLTGGQLHAHYLHAEATLIPSIYEGFGLPVLEAFRYGSPVLCSDHPALRETAGTNYGGCLRLESGEWLRALKGMDREALLRQSPPLVHRTWKDVANDMIELFDQTTPNQRTVR